jgi:hypothetical protein
MQYYAYTVTHEDPRVRVLPIRTLLQFYATRYAYLYRKMKLEDEVPDGGEFS